jgi:hypothetical protein
MNARADWLGRSSFWNAQAERSPRLGTHAAELGLTALWRAVDAREVVRLVVAGGDRLQAGVQADTD